MRVFLFDMETENKVVIYTDGACSGNPGVGGWGAVLCYGNNKKEISGFDANSTNNKMELTAIIKALEQLKKQCEVVVFTDSKYVKDGITQWIIGWQQNDWKNSKKEEVKNKHLWLKLLELSNQHNIQWNWVKGHAENEYNNRADFLATNEIKNFKNKLKKI